ncbi:MAG: ABC transporter permease subunit, partial [Synergistetes bacterium]|nr:ABC transporter permease subunit [Synergistota bacterium]
SVPQEFRLASLALGATQWQTIWKVVLPSALHSILTATIIVVGRVAGETAPIIFTGAAFYTSHLPRNLFDQVMALPYYVYVLATSAPDIDAAQPIEYGTVLVLMIIVLSINMVAVFLRGHFRKRYRW